MAHEDEAEFDYVIDKDTTKIIRFMPEFLRDGPNLNDLTDSVAKEIEIALNFLAKAKSQIQISSSTNASLDDLGQMLLLTRAPGEDDDAFRARILSHVNLTTSSGTHDDIKHTIANFTSLTIEEITIVDVAPGVIEVSLSVGPDLSLSNEVVDIINRTKAAGIFAFTDITGGLPIEPIVITDSVSIVLTPAGRLYGIYQYGGPLSTY